jgi:hypothetical protein
MIPPESMEETFARTSVREMANGSGDEFANPFPRQLTKNWQRWNTRARFGGETVRRRADHAKTRTGYSLLVGSKEEYEHSQLR